MASYISWTAPSAGVHPRCWASNTNGPTVSTLQTRKATTHASWWSLMRTWCMNKKSEANSYFFDKELEYITALAAAYMIGGETACGNKAVSICDEISQKSGLASESRTNRRRWSIALAFTYDWCYALLDSSEKANIKAGVATLVNSLKPSSTDQFIWGADHGNIEFATTALPAILNDGTTEENATWSGWMDDLMDFHDDGTSVGYWPTFRYFAKNAAQDAYDGGSYKGNGQHGYTQQNEMFMMRLFPCMKTALDVDFFTDEGWYEAWMYWILWHWRCDRSFHTQGDCIQNAHYSQWSEAHAMQIADFNSGALGEASQWLCNEIQSANDLGYSAWGPFYQWYLFWYNTARTATKPTLANLNSGNAMKEFESVTKICLRDNWDTTGTSVTISIPKFYLMVHQHRDAGHFDLATKGQAMLVEHGQYDGNQVTTYKEVGDPLVTSGHRFTYMQRIIAKNCVRIVDSNEESENFADSCTNNGSQSGIFGTSEEGVGYTFSNVGDQLWPMNTLGTESQPMDLTDLVGGGAESKWVYGDAFAHSSEATGYAYVVADLTDYYYANKVPNYYRRHWLWIKSGQIEGWNEPVLIVWDDIDTGAHNEGKTTTVLHLQSSVAPTGTAASLTITRGDARLYAKCLLPASVEKTDIERYYDCDNEIYCSTVSHNYDDSGDDPSGAEDNDGKGAFRTELNPPSYDGTTDYLMVYFPCEYPHSTLPAISVIDDGTWVGVQFNTDGLIAKMKRGTSHEVSFSTDEPPAAPTGLDLTVESSTRIDLDWDDNTEEDLANYKVYRATWSGSEWGEWSVVQSPSGSSWSNTGLTASTTYRYKVTAVDDGSNESDASDIKSATTDEEPPESGTGAGIPPWRLGRRFSKYYLRLQ